jgi:hypothetical protein
MQDNPKLQTATHNAWAYRTKPPEGVFLGGRGREESFDDGETGCGDFLLRTMRELNASDTLVVLTRWYGGIMLGPDRWRIMRNCVTDVLGNRLRKAEHEVSLGGEAVWGLDLEAARSKATVGGYGSGTKQHETSGVVGMQIHRPETARNYLLKSFATAPTEAEKQNEKAKTPKKKTIKSQDLEKEENLGLLLGALRIVFDSWVDHISPTELDRRAWGWYVGVRPDVENGPGGWGAKGTLKLSDILKLRRPEGV